MRTAPALLIATLALVLAGCGGPYHRTARGDSDGVPVRIEVEISRQFVRDLPNRGPGGREYVVYNHGLYSGWWGGYGHPGYYGYRPPGYRYRYDPFWYSDVYWTGPAPTAVYLLGGDGPGQARLLRTELDYGVNLIDVPVRPGRTVTLTVQAYGGHEGWETIGSFTAADRPGQVVRLDLTEHAPIMRITDPDGKVSEVKRQPPMGPSPPPAPAPSTAPAAPASPEAPAGK
jgi:hypothetical protein